MQAHFDCFSGISGDMALGALIDLGTAVDWLQNELSRLPLEGFQLTAASVMRNGIRAQQVTVDIKKSIHSRDYKKIKALLEDANLSDAVRSRSLAIFERLARAEAGIHGCSLDDVHFHEVGGIDAIVDIVGTMLCLEKLGIDKITASRIPLGSGFIDCQHGKLPVPAPATVAILKDAPVYGTDAAGELVTPTGAAIIRTLAESFGPLPPMHMEKIGYGAGQRELTDRPNVLRIIMGKPSNPIAALQTDDIIILETCIDDMNPELFGFIMERLFADGALDVYWLPVHMKKDRPGTLIQVLCKEAKKDQLMQRLLSETTSLGVRFYTAQRKMLARELLTLHTSFGEVQIKRVKDPDGVERLIPEYDVCREIALQQNIPLRVVYDTIAREAAAKNAGDK